MLGILRFLWTASRGYRLTPWRSPYLRWRIETYWGLDAGSIGAREFWRFCAEHRGELWRFLKWASRLR
ncbi:MAG: hypothetical protein WHT08_09510 [Bryobacteraceae bacterium]